MQQQWPSQKWLNLAQNPARQSNVQDGDVKEFSDTRFVLLQYWWTAQTCVQLLMGMVGTVRMVVGGEVGGWVSLYESNEEDERG